MSSRLVVGRSVLSALVVVGAAVGVFPPGALAQQTVSPLVRCTGTYNVAVSSGWVSWPQNTRGRTTTFTVTNYSDPGCRTSFSLSATATGPIDSVVLNKMTTANLQPGASDSVTATYNVGAEGSGTLTLHTLVPAMADGSYAITVVAPPENTTYTLSYAGDPLSGDSVLDRITDPAGRILDATISGGLLKVLKDPSGDSVLYAYDAQRRDTSRTDRLGHRTTYGYADSLHVTSVAIPLSSQTDLGTATLTNWDEQGLVIGQPGGTHAAVDTATVYTQLDGPRDVADTTTFWVDRWGAPVAIHDALGQATVITRGDATVPALVTQVQDPTGFVTQATYDGRGNVLTTTEVNPYGDGRNATTRYAWDAAWDFVTLVKRPEGDSLVLAYDTSNGNRLWQQDGRGSSSRVTFNYGNGYHLLSSVVYPGGAKDSVAYGAALGNPVFLRTPLGYLTTRRQDAAGRDTLVLTPIDTGQQYHEQQRTYYDAMNRDTLTEAIGPAINGAPAESILVRNKYDKEGHDTLTSRWSRPDPAGIGSITTRWAYDFAGRPFKEIAPNGSSDSTVYDPAGNPTTVFTRRTQPSGARLSITMTYDPLNHLAMRILPPDSYPSRPTNFNIIHPVVIPDYAAYTVPADTQTFTYDAVGRLVTAYNTDARVSRSYFANGRLKTDSLRIQTVNHDDWNRQQYGITYAYDLNGRRTALVIPQALAAGGETAIDYTYHPQLDAVQTITDVQANPYTLGYNNRGELDSIQYPGNYTERFTYNLDGSLVGDTIRNAGGTTIPRMTTDPIRAASFAVDAEGRMTRSVDPSVEITETDSAAYTGLGHLSTFRHTTSSMDECWPAAGACWYAPEFVTTRESYTVDALANRTSWSVFDSTTDTSVVTGTHGGSSTYATTGTGLLLSTTGDVTTNYSYDPAGDVVFTTTPLSTPAEERASFFAADGLLRRSEYRWATSYNTSNEDQKYVTEEYRYDALGRRVWVKAERWCVDGPHMDFASATECRISFLRRIVWDGDQELAEIQMPWGLQISGLTITTTPTWWENDSDPVNLGTFSVTPLPNTADPNPYFGHVIYAGFRKLDEPLAVTRVNYVMALDVLSRQANYQVKPPFTVNPFWMPRGDAPLGVFSNGYRTLCDPPSSMTSCVALGWVWYQSAFDRQRGLKRASWNGTLLEGNRDKSGLDFKRNRYYDPATGRFTQEDPIGLAGGLNLYGFANGDPVNFSDPFGLCPKYAGGDGKTETAADCPREVLDQWSAQHVSLAKGASWDDVDPELHDAVTKASIELNTDFHVSATTNGRHAPRSFHRQGWAVDIDAVSGQALGDMRYSQAVGAGTQVAGAVSSFLTPGRLAEEIRPGYAAKWYGTPWPSATQAQLIIDHRGHVHLAVFGWR